MLDNNSNEQVKCWLHDFFKYSKKMEDGMTNVPTLLIETRQVLVNKQCCLLIQVSM